MSWMTVVRALEGLDVALAGRYVLVGDGAMRVIYTAVDWRILCAEAARLEVQAASLVDGDDRDCAQADVYIRACDTVHGLHQEDVSRYVQRRLRAAARLAQDRPLTYGW